MSQQIISDPAGILLISQIAVAALSDAKRLGLNLPTDEKEAQELLVKRVIRAIETGETDMGKLREIALLPTPP